MSSKVKLKKMVITIFIFLNDLEFAIDNMITKKILENIFYNQVCQNSNSNYYNQHDIS